MAEKSILFRGDFSFRIASLRLHTAVPPPPQRERKAPRFCLPFRKEPLESTCESLNAPLTGVGRRIKTCRAPSLKGRDASRAKVLHTPHQKLARGIKKSSRGVQIGES
ncbi:hypothetical protein AVEN_86804-1 [Araneus ventricosus]|uniref:Uncharacterized protein n=1 Tax=Araneus ventricosus TaxID=182803 RepID=A0A4Y2D1C6_ARAVE|nr:hypothetical protein AVEN_86804-1 [Araneus ventricosus]